MLQIRPAILAVTPSHLKLILLICAERIVSPDTDRGRVEVDVLHIQVLREGTGGTECDLREQLFGADIEDGVRRTSQRGVIEGARSNLSAQQETCVH